MYSILLNILLGVIIGLWFLLTRIDRFKGQAKHLIKHGNTYFLVLVLPLACLSVFYAFLHVLLVYELTPNFLMNLTSLVIGAPNSLDESRYPMILTDMIAVSAFLFAAFAVLQQSISRERLEAEVLRKQGFTLQAIKEPGVDDLIEMHKHFKDAISLSIFGGSCDWIPDNPDLKEVITKLAGKRKLQLISFRGENVVAQQFEEKNESMLFESLRSSFSFDSGFPEEHKCTLITKRPSRLEVMFMSPPDSEGHIFNVSLLESRPQSEQLLHILKDLIEKGWGKPGDNATADSAESY